MWFFFMLPLFFFLFYIRRKTQHQFFKNRGIPGPAPNWLFGNLLSFNNTTRPQSLWIKKCTEQYGKMWGYFEGPKPILVVADLQLVQEVTIKQFSNFHGRKLTVQQDTSNEEKKVSMFNAHGERWKRLRTVVNPAFSEFKMRNMFHLMKKCIDVIMVQFEEESKKKDFFDAYKYYKMLTLEVIGECAFGTSLHVQTDENQPILTKIKTIFDAAGQRPFLVLLAGAIPELSPIVRCLFKIFSFLFPAQAAFALIHRTIGGVIRTRKEDPSLCRTDILQLMLDAEDSAGSGKALSKHEVSAQSLLFLAAGYETSSTALALITHEVANHPEVQEKLQAEIDNLYKDSDDPSKLEETSDHLASMEYLNNVILEVLRLHPISPQGITRKCMNTAKIAGCTLPAGAYVISDILSIHFDPEVWGPSDPYQFNPDRFSSGGKRHAAAFLTFGAGPRSCIGQRFALTEIRAVLFRLLRRFSIRSRTKQLKFRYRPTVGPAEAVEVFLEPRDI